MIKAIRGTRDLLPPDTALWEFVESVARETQDTFTLSLEPCDGGGLPGTVRNLVCEAIMMSRRSIIWRSRKSCLTNF